MHVFWFLLRKKERVEKKKRKNIVSKTKIDIGIKADSLMIRLYRKSFVVHDDSQIESEAIG
jgi:hypothetical protein